VVREEYLVRGGAGAPVLDIFFLVDVVGSRRCPQRLTSRNDIPPLFFLILIHLVDNFTNQESS